MGQHDLRLMNGHEAVFLQPLLDGPAPRGALGLVTAPFHADMYTSSG